MKTNLVIVAISLFFAFVVGELVARSFIPQNVIMDDPILGHRRVPNTGYDERGFKNNVALETARIVAIGDSQTEGNNASIAESWPQVMGEKLEVSTYQMALGGYSPVQYAALLDDALTMDPELLIVGFYSGNDTLEATRLSYSNDHWASLRSEGFVPFGEYRGSVPKDVSIVFKHSLSVDSWELRFLKLRNWIRSKSQLYTLAGRGTRSLREKLGLAETSDERTRRVLDWARDPKNQEYGITYDGGSITTLLSPTYRLDVVDLANPDVAEGFRISTDRLEYMAARSASAGVSFLLLYIPTKEAVYVEYMKSHGEEVPKLLTLYFEKEEQIKEAYFEFCERTQLICFDVTSALVEGLDSGEAVYPDDHDGHPTAAGYRRIGTTIAGFIEGNGDLLMSDID